jgi:hypothetical protein
VRRHGRFAQRDRARGRTYHASRHPDPRISRRRNGRCRPLETKSTDGEAGLRPPRGMGRMVRVNRPCRASQMVASVPFRAGRALIEHLEPIEAADRQSVTRDSRESSSGPLGAVAVPSRRGSAAVTRADAAHLSTIGSPSPPRRGRQHGWMMAPKSLLANEQKPLAPVRRRAGASEAMLPIRDVRVAASGAPPTCPRSNRR